MKTLLSTVYMLHIERPFKRWRPSQEQNVWERIKLEEEKVQNYRFKLLE